MKSRLSNLIAAVSGKVSTSQQDESEEDEDVAKVENREEPALPSPKVGPRGGEFDCSWHHIE